MGIKVFNNFPEYINQLYNNYKILKLALKKILYFQSFYTLEYSDFKYDKNKDIIWL
jgi:hypothetical protein